MGVDKIREKKLRKRVVGMAMAAPGLRILPCGAGGPPKAVEGRVRKVPQPRPFAISTIVTNVPLRAL